MNTKRWALIAVLATVLALLMAGPAFAGGHPDGPPGLERAIAAQEAHTDELLAKPGVVGTAVGLNPRGQPVVQVFTEHAGVAGIPDSLDDVPVQIKVTGPFVAQDDKTTVYPTPVPIGVSSSNVNSIDFPFCFTGTLGAKLKVSGGSKYALSNNHVYANINSSNGAIPGTGIIQPGLADSGCTTGNTSAIGTLYAYVPIDFGDGDNLVDAAIAITTDLLVDTATPEGLEPSTRNLLCESDACGNLLGTPVQKRGRTTHLTEGTITGVNATVTVNYGRGNKARFVKQLMAEGNEGDAFSAGGDSGSLVMTANASADPVGLLFAGSDSSTIFSRIDLVFSELASNVCSDCTAVAGLSVDGKAPVADTGADLAVSKTVDNATPSELDSIAYTVTVSNNGPDGATSVAVTDNEPAGVSFGTTLATQGSYNSATGVWTVGSLAKDASATLTINATVGAGTGGTTITNTASAAATEDDPNTTNNSDSVDITVVAPGADLAVSKTVDNATPSELDSIAYTVTVSNNGPDGATSVAVTDNEPAGVSFGTTSATQGSYNSATGVWTVGSLAKDASATLTINATVGAGTGGTTITNTASAAATEDDPNTINNSDSVDITVAAAGGGAPGVSACNPANGDPGQRLTVVVTGSNFVDGATADFGERVTVQEVTFVSSSQLDVRIKVHRRAASGLRDVTVTNPDSQSGTGTGCFTVN